MAPEVDGGLDLVAWLAARGLRVALGHSGATFDEAMAAVGAGARHATHLFNSMAPIHHRAPGLAGAVLQADDIAAEIICDGVHVHPALIRTAVSAKRPSRVMAVTDGTAAAGLPPGSRARLGDQSIVSGDTTAYLPDGTLAGSVLTMDRAFEMLVTSVGLSLVDAATMCATTPARELGLAGHGVVAVGAVADLVVLDSRLTRTASDAGRPISEVFRERPDLIRVLSGAFEMTTLPNRAELRLKDIDRVIGYTLSQVKDDAGRPTGAVLFFKDLTQVEEMEERERLRDRLASLGEMAAGIAHELKNPLAGIEVMAGLLRRQVPDSPDAQLLLADIMSEAKLANAIVVEMLEFVRPIRLQVDRTDVAEVLRQAVVLAEGKVPRRDVMLALDLAPALPAIDGDLHQLCQVFSNLLINAFEALDGRGRVSITATAGHIAQDPALGSDIPATPAIIVDVVDDGPGVPPDLSDQIFTPFFSTKPKGSGLGLPIVRKIVDAHDGRIDLSSTPGAGTRFRVTLPVSTPQGAR